MRFRIAVPAIAGILASIALASVVAKADDTPVMLKYSAKTGDSQHQQTVIKTNVAGMDIVVKQLSKRLVKDVNDAGDVTSLVVDEGVTYTLAGNDQHQDPGPDITVKRDKLGKLTDWKPAKDFDNPPIPPEVMRTSEQLYTVVLPTDAVKEKDTWKSEIDNPIYAKMKIKVTGTYLGIEKVDGVDLWKIKQTASVPLDADGNVTTFDGTFWLNPVNGQVVKLDGNVKDMPTAQVGKVTLQVSVSQVKDEKPAVVDKKTSV